MLHALRTLRQRHLARQRKLAEAVAHIDELDRTYPDGSYCDLGDRSVRYTAAWEELFARPEWSITKPSHLGWCGCCGAAVGATETVCAGCGAAWAEPNPRDRRSRRLIFGGVAVTLSTTIGYLSGELFSAIATISDGTGSSVTEWHREFITFVASYIWISVTIISALASTYVYEKAGLAPKGRWIPADKT